MPNMSTLAFRRDFILFPLMFKTLFIQDEIVMWTPNQNEPGSSLASSSAAQPLVHGKRQRVEAASSELQAKRACPPDHVSSAHATIDFSQVADLRTTPQTIDFLKKNSALINDLPPSPVFDCLKDLCVCVVNKDLAAATAILKSHLLSNETFFNAAQQPIDDLLLNFYHSDYSSWAMSLLLLAADKVTSLVLEDIYTGNKWTREPLAPIDTVMSAIALMLRYNPTITRVKLKGTFFLRQAQSLQVLLHPENGLTTLELSVTRRYFDMGVYENFFRALAAHPSLQWLDLYGTSLTVEGITALANALQVNSCLTTLGLGLSVDGDVPQTQAVSRLLAQASNLQSLDFSYNKLSDEGAEVFAAGLKQCSTLQHLHLDGLEGSPHVRITLFSVLKYLSLESLSFKGCGDDIQNYSDTDAEALALAESLAVTTSLRSLNLDNYVFDDYDSGITHIMEALRIDDSPVVSLNLGSSTIHYSGAVEIAETLKVNTSLTSLALSKPGLGLEGMTVIRTALEGHNNALVELEFFENSGLNCGEERKIETILARNENNRRLQSRSLFFMLLPQLFFSSSADSGSSSREENSIRPASPQ